jgi:transcriptional regulator with XRE-family HTH domain
MKSGLSLSAVSVRTGIPIHYLSEFERGERALDDADLAMLARVYNYTDPSALAREATIVPSEEQPA